MGVRVCVCERERERACVGMFVLSFIFMLYGLMAYQPPMVI